MNTTRPLAAGLSLLLLSACSTLPPKGRDPGYQNPEGYFGLPAASDLPVETAPGIQAIRPRWRPLSAGGELSVLAGKIEKPRLEFWALKIELGAPPESRPSRTPEGEEKSSNILNIPNIRIVLGAGEGAPPRPGYVSSTRVSSFVLNKGLLAGINATPFDPSSAREGEERRLAGIAITGGKIAARPVSRFDALVFYAEGGAAIVNQGEIDIETAMAAEAETTAGTRGETMLGRAGETEAPPETAKKRILHAAGGFHRILQDGELTDRALQKAAAPRHARSAAGLSGGGRTLYLMVIDGGGGLSGRRGATEAETALILKQLGARDVLNLDGGGSSALALRFSDGGVETLNTPALFPGRERAVALCLGIALE